MELINHRYKTLKLLKSDKVVSTFLVNDMWDKNNKMILKIINSEFIPNSIIDFYSKEFVNLINLKNINIVKNYSFNSIINTDNKRDSSQRYFFTSEYIEEKIGLIQFIKKMSFDEILELFITLCNSVNYLHLNGYCYGNLNLENIFISKKEDEYILKLKDLVSVNFKDAYIIETDKTKTCFKPPEVLLRAKKDKCSDIYSLSIMLLAMMKKERILNPVKDELIYFTNFLDSKENTIYTYEEINYIKKLISIINKLIENTNYYNTVGEFIDDINIILDKRYNIIPIKEMDRLNFQTGIVGRKTEINSILKSYDSLNNYKTLNKIFLVEGDIGTGKSRYLQELKFLFQFKKADVYYDFNLDHLNKDGDKLWTEILKHMVLKADKDIIDKYKEELIKYLPNLATENNLSKDNIKKLDAYRLINRLGGFISETAKKTPSVFIIDNIHYADEFTINTFSYICSELLPEKNLMLIFSYKKEHEENKNKFNKFISDIKKRKDSITIYMKNFSLEETGEFIKCVMHMSFIPKKFAKKIYFKTQGNPRFVLETIKDLYNRDMIYIDDKTGIWRLDIPEKDIKYESLDIPESIVQVAKNQIKDIKGKSLEVLQMISIFTSTVSIKILEKVLDINLNIIIDTVKELLDKGILIKKINDVEYLYEINNKVLKDVVYDTLLQEDRLKKHKIVSDYLRNNINLDETHNLQKLIYHLMHANLSEDAKKCYLKNANRLRVIGNKRGEISNLEKVLSLIENEDIDEEITLLKRIGSLYIEIEKNNEAIKYYNRAEQLAKITNNKKDILDIYINKIIAMNIDTSQEETNKYIEKSRVLLHTCNDLESSLRMKHIYATIHLNKNEINETIRICKEIIEEAGERFDGIKIDVYRVLGYIYKHTDRVDEALELYNKSLKLSRKIKSIKSELKALNNIGGVYLDIYNNSEKALEYFEKVKMLSLEYGYISIEIVATLNIAVIHENALNYNLAIKKLEIALDKALSYNLSDYAYIIYNELYVLNLIKNRYVEAFKYYQLTSELVKNKSSIIGKEIIRFYYNSGRFFNQIGDFEKAYHFFDKSVNYYKENRATYNLQIIVHFNVLKLKLKLKSDYTEILKNITETVDKINDVQFKISIFSIVSQNLYKSGNIRLAKEFIDRAGEYIDLVSSNKWKAEYFYVKAIVYENEKTLDNFSKALELAKCENKKLLIAKIRRDLGEYYFNKQKYLHSSEQFIYSHQIFKEIILQIPDEYKLNFANNFKVFMPCYRLNDIKNLFTIKKQDISEIKDINLSNLDELNNLLNCNIIGDYIKNEKFMDFIIDQDMKTLPKEISNKGDIIKNLGKNSADNIRLILKYLKAINLATRAVIISQTKKQEFKILFSCGVDEDNNLSDKNLFNRYLFNKIKVTKEPILITSNNLGIYNQDDSITLKDVDACICIPIILDSSETLFLYLETDRVLNNFNEEYLKKSIEFVNLLTLLIKNYKLTRIVSIDDLTGVYTRKYLEKKLEQTLIASSETKEDFSIIMYDLDRFKRINDSYGHQIGDEVLTKVSKVIKKNISSKDFVGRYGGEEFIIVLPELDSKKTLKIAEDLRKKIQNKATIVNNVEITVSMGIASYPDHALDIKSLIEKADQALYSAKQNGRNRCEVWNRRYVDKSKSMDPLKGILTGNDIKDYRKILTIVELIQIMNKNISREEKIHSFLGRIIEDTKAQYGVILSIEKGTILESFQREAQIQEWQENIYYNYQIINQVIQNKKGLYCIDWEYVNKEQLIAGIPEWISIVVEPIVIEEVVVGVLYLSSFTKFKEFGEEDLNYVNILGNLIGQTIKQDQMK